MEHMPDANAASLSRGDTFFPAVSRGVESRTAAGGRLWLAPLLSLLFAGCDEQGPTDMGNASMTSSSSEGGTSDSDPGKMDVGLTDCAAASDEATCMSLMADGHQRCVWAEPRTVLDRDACDLGDPAPACIEVFYEGEGCAQVSSCGEEGPTHRGIITESAKATKRSCWSARSAGFDP